MKVRDVLACSFSNWYYDFKDLTIRSYILKIPQDFLDYLQADGVVLTHSSSNEVPNEDDIEGEDLDVVWDEDEPSTQMPAFPEFEAVIKSTIKRLGGKVFPKLNWSAPRDAHWISVDKTLQCTCPDDIYLLLKSSEFITHDLSQAFLLCDDFEGSPQSHTPIQYDLVLRKYVNITPGAEFRCFVKNKHLLAITQRNHTVHYDYIKPKKEEIVEDIKTFFHKHIQYKFPLEHFVFDVYRPDKNRVVLLDFNPFGSVTDGLLFTWEELDKMVLRLPETLPTVSVRDEDRSGNLEEDENENMENTREKHEIEEVAFRFVEESEGVMPHPYTEYGIPLDVKHLSSGEDPYKLIDLLKLSTRNQIEESSSDEDE